MERQYSGIGLLRQLFAVMTLVTLLCLLGCGGYALYSTQQELVYCNEAALDVYFSGLANTAEDLAQFCETIYGGDPSFLVLAMGRDMTSGAQRLLAQDNVRRMIRSRVSAYTGILVFDDRDTAKDYAMGSEFLGGIVTPAVMQTMAAVRSCWLADPPDGQSEWVVYRADSGAVLLMYAVRSGHLYLCTMIDLTAYAPSAPKQGGAAIEYAFLTASQILTNTDYVTRNGITLAAMTAASDEGFHLSGLQFILQTRFDARTGVGLCGIISTSSIWSSWWVFLLLLTIAVLTICGVFLLIYTSAKRILIYPMERITEATRQIAEGNPELGGKPQKLRELQGMQEALATLVQQKITLETEKTQQRAAKEHAMLQYYQLQTRSHFLLNCLKSLYNLVARGEQEKTLRIITRFSNHIRYVFHDSLTFVPIRAELEEVDDYFEIIGLEREDHILLKKQVDPLLLDFPIPPLLIQTFLENFQKHNTQSEKILRFAVRIDHLTTEGRRYVRIRMSDNGTGYSEEALTQLQELGGVFAQFHVGIQNLCRRIDILYRNQQKTAFFNLPGGGACSVFYLPAEEYLAGLPEEPAEEEDPE